MKESTFTTQREFRTSQSARYEINHRINFSCTSAQLVQRYDTIVLLTFTFLNLVRFIAIHILNTIRPQFM